MNATLRTMIESDRPAIAAIEAAVQAKDFSRAGELANESFPDGIEHPLVLYFVAERMQQAENYSEALTLLERARSLDPANAQILNDVGHCCFNLGRAQQAMQAFDAALALEPDMLAALCNKAALSAMLGDRPAAMRLYRRASLVHPGEPAPLSALALLAARSGDAVHARAHAKRALAVDPAQLPAALALAEADLHERAFPAAEARLRRLLDAPGLPVRDRPFAFKLLGDTLDGLDRPDEAYPAYLEANRLRSLHPMRASQGEETPFQFATRLLRYFETATPADWKTSPGPDTVGAAAAQGHIFLLGFPRSGTTLLEQALASHPGIVSLEETSALAASVQEWMRDNEALDRLARLTLEEADRSRALYWRGVRELADLGDGRKVVVDKGPLHTVTLPLIAQLFPDAKIIFALRDPRDVVFSCFRRRVSLKAEFNEFSSPELAASYYDRVMTLGQIYLALLPLRVQFIRHEHVVEDFRDQVTDVLRFMGLDWDSAVESFPARARARSKTASVAQVARGLNSDGIGQWRRYGDELRPALPLLEPWVERFGYAERSGKPNRRAAATSSGSAAADGARLAEILAEAQAAVGRGEWPIAFDFAESALAQGLEHLLFFKLRAIHREQEGNPELAVADFERALAEAPTDLGVLNALGLCLAKTGRLGEALQRLDAALAVDPHYAPAHYNRGWTLENMGNLVGARAGYERAVELDPRHAQALSNLASLAVRRSDLEVAHALARRALSLDPAQPTASIALAQVEFAKGELASAERRLGGLLANRVRPTLFDRSVALTTLGDVLDRQDRPQPAFEAYSRANAGLRTLNASRFTGPGLESALARAQRLTNEMALTSAEDWTRSPPAATNSPAAAHVFVVGFPRSGTTLLGQVLASHPEVVTLDEAETLAHASHAILGRPGGLARLASSEDGALEEYRDAYWRSIRAAGVDPRGKVVVDKLPMNLLGLPLIAKMFPDATIIFVRRDPRDAVLSAFRRQFVLNAATWELLTLSGAARFYDAMMGFSGQCLERLALNMRVQTYEALVADIAAEGRALGAFIGLDWNRAASDFSGAARAGRIATPSAAQIARGLNQESVGQWRRYREPLAPILPLMQTWVDAFGYSFD